MGKGELLDRTTRQIIYNNSISSSPLSVENLHRLLFGHKPSTIKIKTLKKRMNFMKDPNVHVKDIFDYIDMGDN